jgi:hypothetical protein
MRWGGRREAQNKETERKKTHKQEEEEGVQGKGKGEAVEKRKRPMSEGARTAGKAQRGEGV